ncbi:MAG: division/cell wall cluster transcriptional repressor MraZ [Lachnospiraceae bacterium]|nr:division/cell wall cluster transcriptional repressor MraZ [Lachnospiraceae bacterium]
MFMSEYNHSIDAKGRMIVPAKFREALGNDFIVTQGLDGCLFVFPNSEWQVFEEKLRSLPVSNKDARKFSRFFLAGAAQVELDGQGRILLPAVLRQFAGLEKDAVVVGVGSRVEIWDKSRWEENTSFDDMDEIAEHMADLGISI